MLARIAKHTTGLAPEDLEESPNTYKEPMGDPKHSSKHSLGKLLESI